MDDVCGRSSDTACGKVVSVWRKGAAACGGVSMGIMAAWEYRVKWYGETEEQAKAMVVAEE